MPSTPKNFFKENWLLILAAVYVLSPLDFLPDQIPLLGQADDTLVILLELWRRYNKSKS